jgi:alkyl hydroperoxide reductase subunit D
MGISDIKGLLPDYAKDQKLNIGRVLDPQGLDKEQTWGCAVACAVAARNPELQAAIFEEAREQLSEEAFDAARGAAVVMGMNNVYYRFLHMTDDDEYAKMPAQLRMNIIGRPGVDKVNFELWCLAVSAMNGCGACVKSHEKVVRDGGLSKDGVQSSVRIAAVIHALAVALESRG